MDTETKLIEAYLPYLLDTNLMFAILTTWAIVHFAKKSPWITNDRRQASRDWKTIMLSAVCGFAVTYWLKVNDPHVLQYAVIIAFVNSYLYKGVVLVLAQVAPQLTNRLKTKPKQ